MAQAVAERLAEAGVVDHSARSRIRLHARGPHLHRLEPRKLRLEADRVGLAQPLGQRPRGEGARAVGAVTVELGARIHDDGLAGFDLPVAGPRVRARAVRAGCDDRLERRGLGAELVEQLVEAPGQVALGPADEGLFGKARIRLARQCCRPANRLEFRLVLDRAQRLDEAAPRHELEPAGREGFPVAVGEVVRLETVLAFQQLGQCGVERALRLDELDALDRAAELGVAEVAEQPHALRLDHERRVGALEADQVAHVDEVRDDQRLLEARLQAFDPGHCGRSARKVSASW